MYRKSEKIYICFGKQVKYVGNLIFGLVLDDIMLSDYQVAYYYLAWPKTDNINSIRNRILMLCTHGRGVSFTYS